MTHTELLKMIHNGENSGVEFKRDNFRVESRPVSGATLADLDIRRLVNYFGQIRQQDTPPENDSDAWQRLTL